MQFLSSKYGRMVYGTSVRILRNSADAEEVTQECFVALASAKASPHGSMAAWLHRIATYQALNRRRNDRRRREREQSFASARPETSELQWDDVSEFVDQSIEALPENIRSVIIAHFIEGHSVTEIAASEGVTHSAISQRIQRGVALIRDRMRRNGIPIAGTLLFSMLTHNASAWPDVPPQVAEVMGKIALTGAHPAPVAARTSSIMTPVAAVVTALAVGAIISIYAVSSDAPPDAERSNSAQAQPRVAEAAVIEAPPRDPAPNTLRRTTPTVEPRVANPDPPAADPVPLTWRDVVDRYAAHQDRIRRIRFDYEHSGKGDYFWYDYAPEPGYREFFRSGSLTTDGERCAMRQFTWGHSFGGRTLSRDQAEFGAYAYDGDTYVDASGLVQIHPNAINSQIQHSAFRNGRIYLLFSRYPGGPMIDLPLCEGWRLEELLYGAHAVNLRPDKENVNGMECFVVDADTNYGQFTVWFCPDRDFNVARSQIEMGPGDINETSPLMSGASAYYEYVAKSFSRVDGKWVATEAAMRQIVRLRGGNGYDYQLSHKRTNIDILTEGEDDGLYVVYADDIDNGTELLEMNVVKRKGDPRWVWQNDRFVQVTGGRQQNAARQRGAGRGFGAGMIAQGSAN